jgi:hypothetical protein
LFKDRIDRCFLLAVLAGALIYVGLGWSPSSYGVVLGKIQASEAGPVAGTARDIRGDEWSVVTPYLQAAVRNGFRRFNETSFYREDMRNFYAMPLQDWGLAYKPQFWAFFVLPPAVAFSLYHALWMAAFLVGYELLFRELGAAPWMAVALALLVFFSGFTQFWWTIYGPSLTGFAWILVIALRPMRWWIKALVCAWAFPVWVMALVYPTLLLTLGWCGLILIVAMRPRLLRSYGDVAAVVAGAVVGAVVVYGYYTDVIPVMRNTVYPGRRVALAGTAHIVAVMSQVFPFAGFRLGDYENLVGPNICEISAVGTFLPLLTLCLTRWREAWAVRRPLLILLAGLAAITLWEIAPVPGWIGGALLWNTGPAARWLFASGLLMLVGCLLIWREGLVSFTPARIVGFLLLGPVVSLGLKVLLLMRQAGSIDMTEDLVACGVLLVCGVAACSVPGTMRARVLLIGITVVNIYGFGRFNPLQPARPIFQVPETDVVRELRKEGDVLVSPPVLGTTHFGAALNGLGFRSVDHVLMAPQLAFFRHFFPAMEQGKFEWIFNRYATVHASARALPAATMLDTIEIPMEVFVPVRNRRRALVGAPDRAACSMAAAGGVDRVMTQGGRLVIEGWASWIGESGEQGIRVLSARTVKASLATITRADVAEWMSDYGRVKAGFRLQVWSEDGKAVKSDDVVLVAVGTPEGERRLACCGCR